MKIAVFLFSLTLISCSTPKKQQLPRSSHSKKVKKSFEQLEREQALEHYRRLRENSPKSYTHKRKKRIKRKKVVRRVPKVNADEQRIKLGQYLSYFCMKNRKEERFELEGSCEKFTNNLLSNCLKSFNWGEKGLTNCTRSHLR